MNRLLSQELGDCLMIKLSRVIDCSPLVHLKQTVSSQPAITFTVAVIVHGDDAPRDRRPDG